MIYVNVGKCERCSVDLTINGSFSRSFKEQPLYVPIPVDFDSKFSYGELSQESSLSHEKSCLHHHLLGDYRALYDVDPAFSEGLVKPGDVFFRGEWRGLTNISIITESSSSAFVQRHYSLGLTWDNRIWKIEYGGTSFMVYREPARYGTLDGYSVVGYPSGVWLELYPDGRRNGNDGTDFHWGCYGPLHPCYAYCKPNDVPYLPQALEGRGYVVKCSDDLAKSILSHCHATLPPQPAGIESYLWEQALKSDDFEGKNISNILQTIDLIKDLKSLNLTAIANDFRSKSRARQLSDSWLSYNYSVKTTISDLCSLKDTLSKLDDSPSTLRSGYQYGNSVYHLKADVSPSKIFLGDQLHFLRRLQLLPDLGTVWDMLPYSFVLDWFLPISDGLDQVDAEMWHQQCYWDVNKIVMSRKTFSSVINQNYSCAYSYYNRWVTTTVPQSEFFFDESSLKKNPFTVRHILSGTSLIIQRR